MTERNYDTALKEIEKFIKEREEIIKSAGDWIDRYIADRALPMELKDKCADWQQELIDVLEAQVLEAKDYYICVKEKMDQM
ncbi:hypothetical protein [Peptacetobacter sp.]|uniref:hypothetical protein n=1 Tax=Peptacetobacter sp. TaxID=2991975 RepID=UPI00261780CE|nr:hypothetical protein [Peptacetobacter sp.]